MARMTRRVRSTPCTITSSQVVLMCSCPSCSPSLTSRCLSSISHSVSRSRSPEAGSVVDVSMISLMMESVVWSDMMMMTLESVLQWYLLHSVQVRALPLHNFPDVYLTRWSVRHHNVLLVLL